MLSIGPIELGGDEVLLRPLFEADIAALAQAARESREHYRLNLVPDGLEETPEYVARALLQLEKGERYPFVIRWNQRVVGSTSYLLYQPWVWPPGCKLQRSDRPDVVEVGATWLAASAQRTRCNTEAKFLLLRHAFEVWGVHAVKLRTDVRNQRSRQAIERLGAKFDGLIRADMPGRDCTVRDSAHYSILAAEWPAVKAKLEERLR